jgi:hypothetical protein
MKKLLIIIGLLMIGIVVIGYLTIDMMPTNVDEQSEVAQSTSAIESLNGSQDPSSTNQEINDLVVQSTPFNNPTSNVISLNGNQIPSGTIANQPINDMVLQKTPVNKPTQDVISLNDNQNPSDTSANQLINDLVLQDTPINKAISDAIALKGNKDPLGTSDNKVFNELVIQVTPVSKPISNAIDQAIAMASLYGNKDQSGTRAHQIINYLVLQGTPVNTSILNVIEDAIANKRANILSSEALTSTAKNKATALEFMANMVTANDLFTATKSSIEDKPEDIGNIINVSVVLYPDFAQEVINAAAITGEMDPNEALLAAIAAGADPTTVSEATAAGGNIAAATFDAGVFDAPFGGLGGGGSGDQEVVGIDSPTSSN